MIHECVFELWNHEHLNIHEQAKVLQSAFKKEMYPHILRVEDDQIIIGVYNHGQDAEAELCEVLLRQNIIGFAYPLPPKKLSMVKKSSFMKVLRHSLWIALSGAKVMLGIAIICLGMYFGLYLMLIGGVVDLINQIKAPVTQNFAVAFALVKIVLCPVPLILGFALGGFITTVGFSFMNSALKDFSKS